jgi:hypothetical protein
MNSAFITNPDAITAPFFIGPIAPSIEVLLIYPFAYYDDSAAQVFIPDPSVKLQSYVNTSNDRTHTIGVQRRSEVDRD